MLLLSRKTIEYIQQARVSKYIKRFVLQSELRVNPSLSDSNISSFNILRYTVDGRICPQSVIRFITSEK